MNRWIIEKSMSQVDATIRILDTAGRLDDSLMIGPESVRERLIGEASLIYIQACKLIAYATGEFSEDLVHQAHLAFDKGAKEMKEFAESLSERHQDGWDLPNPVYHSAVLAIERPNTRLP